MLGLKVASKLHQFLRMI